MSNSSFNSAKSRNPENGYVTIDSDPEKTDRTSAGDTEFLELEAILPTLASQLPDAPEIEQLKAWKQDLGWLSTLRQASRVLMAAIAPETFRVNYANDYFCRFFGMESTSTGFLPQEITLFDLFSNLEEAKVRQWYRRHLLYQFLRQRYAIDCHKPDYIEESITLSVNSALYPEPRSIKFWLNSQGLKVSFTDAIADKLSKLSNLSNLSNFLPSSDRWSDAEPLEKLVKNITPDHYRVKGFLLLEAFDVTIEQQMQQIIQMLTGRESILRPEGFRQLDQAMRSLFRADKTLFLSAEQDPARLFSETEFQELSVISYSLESLQGSHFQQAADSNQICHIPDLGLNAPTECDRQLLESGIRSLLLLPLVIGIGPHDNKNDGQNQQTMGLVGLSSNQPNHFNQRDLHNAKQLISPFTVALRQALQQRTTSFNNIHPSVEARFVQEAERRSWGLPPEPIVFKNVYPLYGISDIRGSSQERNRAIQKDLLAQYDLGIKIVEAVCELQKSDLVEQIRLDLVEQIEHLKEGITVDSEVTATEYLQNNLEIYFDYFAECGIPAAEAVQAYTEACANEHQCVYQARARYDEAVSQINQCLRETWESWQEKMQKIIPHYCDIECTDGIDHMIYVGKSIDADFCLFHLRSLRYEQLKAVCDCARTAFKIQQDYDIQLQLTHLVLVQDTSLDIFHDEKTERLFDVGGTRDTRYEIVKKRIDKGVDQRSQERITQPGMLTLVYSTNKEWEEYQKYLCYLSRDGWVESKIQYGNVEPLQGVTGLKFARVRVLP